MSESNEPLEPDTGDETDEDAERTPEEQAQFKREQEARRDAKHPQGSPPGQARKPGGSEPAGEV